MQSNSWNPLGCCWGVCDSAEPDARAMLGAMSTNTRGWGMAQWRPAIQPLHGWMCACLFLLTETDLDLALSLAWGSARRKCVWARVVTTTSGS